MRKSQICIISWKLIGKRFYKKRTDTRTFKEAIGTNVNIQWESLRLRSLVKALEALRTQWNGICNSLLKPLNPLTFLCAFKATFSNKHSFHLSTKSLKELNSIRLQCSKRKLQKEKLRKQARNHIPCWNRETCCSWS